MLTKATESKEETRGASVQEARDLWEINKEADKHTETTTAESLETLLANLGPDGQKLLTAEEITEINKTGQVTIGSRTIVFKEILTIGSEYDKGNIKIGDKLSYSANGTEDWIVFGKDDDGNVLLTTEEPSNTSLSTWSAQLWFDWENHLDGLCKDYGSTLQGKKIEARSIKLEDINRVVGFTKPTFKTYTFTTDSDANYSEQKVNYFYPSSDVAQFPYLSKAISTETTEEFECNWYRFDYNSSSGQYKLNWEDGNNEDLILTKPENMKYVVGEVGSFMQYAVASRATAITESIASFYMDYVGYGNVYGGGNFPYGGPGGCLYSNTTGGTGYSGPDNSKVRPIVELPSDIEVQ